MISKKEENAMNVVGKILMFTLLIFLFIGLSMLICYGIDFFKTMFEQRCIIEINGEASVEGLGEFDKVVFKDASISGRMVLDMPCWRMEKFMEE